MKINALQFILAAFLVLTGSGLAFAQTAPASVSVTATTQNTVSLSWPSTGGNFGFHIVYKPGSSAPANATDGGYVDVEGSSLTSCTVTGLPNNTQYTFAVYGYTQSIHYVKTYGSSGPSVTATTANKTTLELNFEQQGSLVLGQNSFEVQEGANRGLSNPDAASLSLPYGIVVTPTTLGGNSNNKVIIADAGNNRLKIYNSEPTSFNASADVIVGQSNTTSATSGIAQNKFYMPSGICVTTIGGTTYLIVCDMGNNRVLVFNSIPSSTGLTNAWKYFGQPNWTTGTAGCTAAKLNMPIAVTTSGNKLIVADNGNNRVMIWNDFVNAASGSNATAVIGQANFTSNSAPDQFSNTSTAATLSNPYGVAVSRTGKLVVSSRLEHRVLIYDSVPGVTNGIAASMVLGKGNFYENGYSWSDCNDSNMSFLRSVSISSNYTDEKLVVTDLGNRRMMVWNTFPTRSFQPADVLLNRPNMTATYPTTFSNMNYGNYWVALAAPSIDWSEYSCFAPNGDFWISDSYISRVVRFDKAAGEAYATTLTVTGTTTSSISVSWTGNTSLYKLSCSLGTDPNSVPFFTIDNLGGNSYTITGLECNTKYSIALIPKLTSPARYGYGMGAAAATLSSSTCTNLMPITNGSVEAVATYGNVIYLGGSFTVVNGEARNGLAAINATTYALLPFDPNIQQGAASGFVSALKVSTAGDYLYVGGTFDKVGSVSTNGIAKISTSTGVAVSTYPSLNTNGSAYHFAMNYGSDYLFFYGGFTAIGAQTGYFGIGGIDASGNVITSFKPYFDGNPTNLRGIAASPDNKYVYLGHNNSTYTYNPGMTTTRKNLVELEVASGDATSFNPAPGVGGVFDIVCTNHSLYIGGIFDKIENVGNTDRRAVAKFTGTPGGTWSLDGSFAPTSSTNGLNMTNGANISMGTVRGMWLNGNRLYLAGALSDYAGLPRLGVCAIDTTSASLDTTFNSGVSNIGNSNHMKLVGSATLGKLFVASVGNGLTYLYGKPYLSNYYEATIATNNIGYGSDLRVSANTTYDFASARTGVKITFAGNSSPGFVVAERYTDAPFNPTGITETNISNYRFILQQHGGPSTPDFTSATVTFVLSAIPSSGITDPSTIAIYRRSSYGYSPFASAGTVTYNSGTGELSVTVTALGEFVFASSDAANPLLQHKVPTGHAAEDMQAGYNTTLSNVSTGTGAAAAKTAQPFIYPNPAGSWMAVATTGNGNMLITIRDINGRLVLSSTVRNRDHMDLTGLPKGVYLVHMTNAENQQNFVQKLIIQ